MILQAQSTPSLGQLKKELEEWDTWANNNHRPVIVAENMLGVAMYELVRELRCSRKTADADIE